MSQNSFQTINNDGRYAICEGCGSGGQTTNGKSRMFRSITLKISLTL